MKSISCLCLTYGRVKMLEEAIYSFITQDYNIESELLILNDCPWQKLHYDHPNVRIINTTPFRTFGEKEDYGINECKYDTIMQFDNDDIGLPNLFRTIDKYFTDGSHLLHWNRGVALYGDNVANIMSLGNSGIVFTKSAWKAVGGYPHRNCGADMDFVVSIERLPGNIVRAMPDDDEICWCYSWGRGSYHCSGMGDDRNRPEGEQIISRHTKFMEEQRASGKEPEGDIHLTPHWKMDYVKLVKDYICSLK